MHLVDASINPGLAEKTLKIKEDNLSNTFLVGVEPDVQPETEVPHQLDWLYFFLEKREDCFSMGRINRKKYSEA